ncbi:MAG TPA: PHP domain-containing protein, partial [Actinomycetota bacterium]|nr:PHP domain-containing protein [Actinomycetota bacterium]
MPTNADLAELLRLEAASAGGHRARALRRAARAAMTAWPEEAVLLAARDDRSLLELAGVGPWIAERLRAWLDDPPPVPPPDETRRDFLTLSRALSVVGGEPGWLGGVRGDLQVHTTYSDGAASIRGMVAAARERGYAYLAVTDHSGSLRVARGMDPERLREQHAEIQALNEELAPEGFRVLRGIELDVFPDGSLDMTPDDLAPLEVVLGAFHTGLREPHDQTERCLRALRHPRVDVLAHPRGRRYDRRVGIR